MTAVPTFLRRNIPLAPLTTIGLGGPAQYYAHCSSNDEIRNALLFARESGLATHVLGGGSNVLFSDEGFCGLVLHVGLGGFERVVEGQFCVVSAAAGEMWDPFVADCAASGLQGLECLSGIPGLVGATPIQNVGAYGQEVAESIVRVSAMDKDTLKVVEFSGDECRFGYRRSRFKEEEANHFVITRVVFRLRINGVPQIRYPELQLHLEGEGGVAALREGPEALGTVRRAVLDLRRRKSMVVDPADLHSKSAGSFFMNPILPESEYRRLVSSTREKVPSFPAADGVKVPAAWLVEHCGFRRGYRKGGVGISANHALALVNYGGTTREVLALAGEIQDAVFRRFSIRLQQEPVLVRSEGR